MSALATLPMRSLLDITQKARQSKGRAHVWCLNLDQIESHSGKVLSKLKMVASGVGSSTYGFEAGTVLYSKLRPYLNKVVVADADGIATTELVPLRCDESKAMPHYLAHFLRSPVFLAFATNVVAGAKMHRMVMGDFWNYPVPLPPLNDQRRITAILDQAETLRTQRRQALAHLDTLTQSLFHGMFGDPAINPRRFQTKSLGEVSTFYGGNSLPHGLGFTGQAGGYFLMKVSDMNLPGNEREIFQCQSWSNVAGSKASTCPIGSIVVPKRGGAIGTNKKRITTRLTVLDPNLMAICPDHGQLNQAFLFQWFLDFDLASIASGSSVPQLNKQDLAPLTMLVPPLPLQKTFATRIQAIEALKATHRTALQELDKLFASLQHRAFTGEL